jgi:hypothetical protein
MRSIRTLRSKDLPDTEDKRAQGKKGRFLRVKESGRYDGSLQSGGGKVCASGALS